MKYQECGKCGKQKAQFLSISQVFEKNFVLAFSFHSEVLPFFNFREGLLAPSRRLLGSLVTKQFGMTQCRDHRVEPNSFRKSIKRSAMIAATNLELGHRRIQSAAAFASCCITLHCESLLCRTLQHLEGSCRQKTVLQFRNLSIAGALYFV